MKDIPTSDKGEAHRFPLEVFPDKLQRIAQEFTDTLQFHPDYIGLTLLTALSAAIGTGASVKVRNMHTEPAIIWAVLVGKPGTSKTHIINHLFEPFNMIDNKNYERYEQELKEYEDADTDTKRKKPKFFQSVLRDFTFEALAESSKINKNGCIVLSDEILSLTGNFNKFNKGSDEPYYLTLFSGLGITTTRKTQEPIHTEKSCVNIIGGIQPAKLRELLTKNRFDNGFAHRFLFAYPDANAEPWGSEQFDPNLSDEYNKIINDLYSLNIPEPIGFDDDAWEVLREWQRYNTHEVNDLNETNDPLAGLRKKWESYLCRFALILQITDDRCRGIRITTIGTDAVKKAIKLFDYFLTQSQKVFGLISRPVEMDKLNDRQLKLYKELPEKFTTAEAKEISKKMPDPLAERSLYDFLKDSKLFVKRSQGNYEKRAL
ncbi:MAG TPA: DUF3987 domain-containing protein [Candidatus Cloacimonas sp.]|jgi:hypothetical protein|nr:DUF3987 domain-containing protein [Candidatus Cloacimonas sp.]